ncbi:MAG: hypothetical protein M9909_04695 [Thermomicrobiales bacterium]|nr:hypothetical protein [Thermomicrobiales bacterium]
MIRKKISVLTLMLAFLLAPHFNASAVADDIFATPVLEEDVEEDTNREADPDEDVIDSPPDSTLKPAIFTDESLVQPAAEIESGFTLDPLMYSAIDNTLTVSLTLNAGFNAEADDVILLGWSSDGYAVAEIVSFVSSSSGDVTAYLIPESQSIAIEFTVAVTINDPETVTLNFSLHIPWEDCGVYAASYTPEVSYSVFTTTDDWQYQSIMVKGETCPGTGEVSAWSVQHNQYSQDFEIYLDLPEVLVAGQQVTVTYPVDKLQVTPGTYGVFILWETEPIGEAVVGDGVVTITITDSGPLNKDILDLSALIEVPATRMFDCEATQDGYLIGELTFVANPGGTFTQAHRALCDPVPSDLVGEWATDEQGNPYIIWTIDTGSVVDGETVQFWSIPPLVPQFDCDSLIVSMISAGSYDAFYCDPWGLLIEIQGEGVMRARVTINAYPVADYSPQSSGLMIYTRFPRVFTDTGAIEWPSIVLIDRIYELFPENGGDFITKSVDRAEVRDGDRVTYTVTASTTSNQWSDITLTDVLPAGFVLDPDSVECVVDVEAFLSDPCYTLVDTTLQVIVRAEPIVEEEWPHYTYYLAGPVTITLTFSGTVTGTPGTVITNEACSERTRAEGEPQVATLSMGDPTYPGGGVICDAGVTTIIGDDPVPPATPSPTATNPAPTETVPATETPIATETPAVTPTETVTPEGENTLIVTITLPDGASIEGAPYNLYAAQASVVFETEPYRSGVVGAKNTIEIDDLLPGTYKLVISPKGMGPIEAIIEVGDQPLTEVRLTVNEDGSVTIGDIAQVTPTASTEEEKSDEVKALPSTGTGGLNGSTGVLMMLGIAASALMMAGGLVVRQKRG